MSNNPTPIQDDPDMLDSHKLLLVVEDSDEDFNALLRTLKQLEVNLQVHRLANGDDALDYLESFKASASSCAATSSRANLKVQAPKVAPSVKQPHVILLDLNLPGTDGREVLEEIKQDPVLKFIPVVVFSSSTNQKDIESCYQLGANSYLHKPMGLDKLLHTVKVFVHYWFHWSVVSHV